MVQTVQCCTNISNLFLPGTMLDCIPSLWKLSGTKRCSSGQWNVDKSDIGHFQAQFMEHTHLGGVSNLLASLGYTGRRRLVLDHTLNTQALMKTDEQQQQKKTVLSKFTILCWAAFIAILGHTQSPGCGPQVGHPCQSPCLGPSTSCSSDWMKRIW